MPGYSLPLSQWFSNGAPAANCQVTVYQTGTTTKVALYSDNALTSPLSNPLTGNVNGEVTFYAAGTTNLRVVVTTSGGAAIADIDPVFPVPSLGGFTGTGTDLQKLVGITNGTATAGKALVTDSANSIGGLTSIATTEGSISPYATDKNLLTGGDFSTNPWQNGTSFTAVATGTYTADQWVYRKSGSMVHTVSRDTDVPTVAQAGRYVSHSLRLTLTTPQASLGVSDYCALVQPIEGSLFQPIAQSAFTLSFWVKATLPGTYCVAFRNGGTDRTYVGEYTVITTATWERKTVTVTASPSAGTWNYSTGTGLEVAFVLAAGTNLQATAASWQTGAYYASAAQVNGVASGATDLRIALVQLEKGPAATTFDSRSLTAEIARCERYFEKSFAIGTAPVQNVGSTSGAVTWVVNAGGTTFAGTGVAFRQRKRTTPTVTLYNPQAANAQIRDLGGSADYTSTAVLHNGDTWFCVRGQTPGGHVSGSVAAVHYTADARL